MPIGKSKQGGVPVARVLISTALKLVLIFGVLQVYLNIRQVRQYQEDLSHLQENAELAANLITQAVMSSVPGNCSNLDGVAPAIVADGSATRLSNNHSTLGGHIDIGEQNWQPALSFPPDIAVPNSGTEVLTAQHRECSVPAVSGSFLPSSTDNAVPGSRLYSQISSTYFIRDDREEVPSLYVLDNLTGEEAKLVRGVENMKVRYSIDTSANSAPDVYLAANYITDWSAVTGTRIELLMRTGTPYSNISQTLDGITYADGYGRRSFQFTIKLRKQDL